MTPPPRVPASLPGRPPSLRRRGGHPRRLPVPSVRTPVFFGLLSCLLAGLLLTCCGLLDPDQAPDEILPVRRLDPLLPTAGVAFSALPDSTGGSGPYVLRWTLPTTARTVLTSGGVLEAVVRAAPGIQATLEGLDPAAGTWLALAHGTGSGPDSLDLWWTGAWSDRAAGRDLVDADGRLRLRLSAHAAPDRAIVRVLEVPAGIWTREPPGHTLATDGANLLLMGSGTIRRWSVQGGELASLTAAGPPPSFCRTPSRYLGVTGTEIVVLGSSGGTWSRAAFLPWTDHGGVAITTDGTDLYLIRHPGLGGGDLPMLYTLSEILLFSTHRFDRAVTDSTELRRWAMTGGVGPGLAWWSDRRVLAAPGEQDGAFGLVTFTRAGRFREFIPLPFEPGPVQLAFAGDYLFLARARPTLEAVGWSGPFTPAPPPAALLWRWRAP